jgi:8-oxo-dGTP pyrophosphatase MutT (NUDIX family)
MGTKKRSRKRNLSVLEDYDQDGVPNFDDCRPLDPTQHGVIWDWGTSLAKKVVKKVTPIVKPVVREVYKRVPTPVKPVVREVYKRVPKKLPKIPSRVPSIPTKISIPSISQLPVKIGRDISVMTRGKLDKPIVPVFKWGPGNIPQNIEQQSKATRKSLISNVFGGFDFRAKGERLGRATVAPTPQRVGLERVPQVDISTVVKKKPSIVSAITSLPSVAVKELSEQYTWMRATPSERAIIAMVPSVTAQTKEFTKDVETYETKWKPHIEGGYFTGTEAQYARQTREYEQLQRGQSQLEKQYGTFTGLEARIPREKKEEWWGIPAAYEREQERTAKWTKERVPSMKDVPVTWFGRDVAIRESFQKAAREQPEVFTAKQLANIQEVASKPPELPMWAERVFRGEQFVVDYQKGMVEGIREKPFETLATTALFAAMPPVMKGLKAAGKATRMAPATKEVKPWVPTISKLGKVPYPTLKRGEAIKIGVPKGILPPAVRHIPTVAGVGMMAPYVGMMGQELYTAPPGERAYTLGRMSTIEILPIVAGTYIGMKAPAFMKETAKTLKYLAMRTKMPMEKLTPEAIIAGRKQIVRIEKGVTPEEFLESVWADPAPYGIPTRYLTAPAYARLRIKRGKLGGIYTQEMPEGIKGVTIYGEPTYTGKEAMWGKYSFVPGTFDPTITQIAVLPKLSRTYHKKQMEWLLGDIKTLYKTQKLPKAQTIEESKMLPEYYKEIFGELPKLPTEKEALFLAAYPSKKGVIAHELFHERYPGATEEQVLGAGFEYMMARGKGKKLFLAGEKMESTVSLWKAMEYGFGKKTVIRRGHFEMPGGYVSPVLQPFFFRMKQPKIKWSLFGEYPTPEMPGTPTAMRIALEEVARMPKDVLATKDPYSMTAWMLGEGKPKTAYVSWPIELGTKMEQELVISPTTGMKWVPSPTGKEYYTTWKHRVIPIEHYEAIETELPRLVVGKTKARTFWKEGKLFEDPSKYYVERARATAIIETPRGVILHKGERGEGYILPGGGIETKAEVAARMGKAVKGETPADAAIREVYEELGTKTKSIEKLFGYEGEGVSLYARGRQKWYSRSIHDVFKMDILGDVKPMSREVSEVLYYKPGMKVKLSEDTQAILDMYFKGVKGTKRAKGIDVTTDISKKVAKDLMSATMVTPQYMKDIMKGAKIRKKRIKRGEVRSFEEQLKYEEIQYADYYTKMQPRRVGIVPLLAVGYAAKPPKEYKIRSYEWEPPTYGIPEMQHYKIQTMPTYGPTKYPVGKVPGYKTPDYKTPTYKTPKYPTPKIPSYWIPGYKTPTYKTPKYPTPKIPSYWIPGYKTPEITIPEYTIPKYKTIPLRDTTVQMPGHKVKKRKYKKKYQFEELPWKEKHYIPTLQELMRVPESMTMTPPTAFTMKMPKMPKSLF